MKWNKNNFSDYFEIYLKVSLDLVKKRDPKGMYKKYNLGEEKNIVGIDVPWHEPVNSDLVVNMNDKKSVSEIVELITQNILLFKKAELI